MHKKVRLAIGVVSALVVATVMVSCDDDDITGVGDPTYTAIMNAANEVGTGSNVTGTGTVVFVDRGTINLFMPNGPTGTLNGEVARGTITDANNANVSLAALRVMLDAGTAYANVHTSQFGGGAIRGQIVRD